MRKEKLAEQYADSIERSEEGLVEQCFLAGYEAAIPKWKKLEEYTPEEDTQILCCITTIWSKELRRYSVLRYFESNWYGDIAEDETVEKWMEIKD